MDTFLFLSSIRKTTPNKKHPNAEMALFHVCAISKKDSSLVFPRLHEHDKTSQGK